MDQSTPKTAPQGEQTEREAFEAWASEGGKWPKAVERESIGNYKLQQTSSAWRTWQAAWQARASMHAQAPQLDSNKLKTELQRWKDDSDAVHDLWQADKDRAEALQREVEELRRERDELAQQRGDLLRRVVELEKDAASGVSRPAAGRDE